jgi:hypothetical protein
MTCCSKSSESYLDVIWRGAHVINFRTELLVDVSLLLCVRVRACTQVIPRHVDVTVNRANDQIASTHTIGRHMILQTIETPTLHSNYSQVSPSPAPPYPHHPSA